MATNESMNPAAMQEKPPLTGQPKPAVNPKKKKAIQRPPQKFSRALPQPKKLSTESTTLTNDPLWSDAFLIEGEQGLASQTASKPFLADAAGYIELVEEEYHAISDVDRYYAKSVPASVHAYYHHLMWWHKVALCHQNQGIATPAEGKLIHFINGYSPSVGAGAAAYLSGMGDFADVSGVKHKLT